MLWGDWIVGKVRVDGLAERPRSEAGQNLGSGVSLCSRLPDLDVSLRGFTK